MVFLSLVLFCGVYCAQAAQPPLRHVDVFHSGTRGYHTFRIPAIATAPDGSLLAFAEARKYSAADPGWKGQHIDLVWRRSTDGGRTWSPMKVLEDPGHLWSAANPAPVVDRNTETIWLFHLRARPGRSTRTARPGLPVVPVACAIERFTLKASGGDRNRILWTGPKGPGRRNLVVRVSYDEGKPFPLSAP